MDDGVDLTLNCLILGMKAGVLNLEESQLLLQSDKTGKLMED